MLGMLLHGWLGSVDGRSVVTSHIQIPCSTLHSLLMLHAQGAGIRGVGLLDVTAVQRAECMAMHLALMAQLY